MNFKKGFTLIELLVVVAIISLLASIILASLSSSRARAADAAVKTDMATVKNQAELQADLQTKEADRANQLLIEDKKQELEYAKLAEAGLG